MGYVRTKGIVVREVNTGEADKVITIFSKNFGKISALAKGARRAKSKLSAGTQFLSYSDFVLFHGREMHMVNSCELIEPFYSISGDIIKLTYSAHLVDIINDVVQENQPSGRILQLFLNSLHMLAKTDKSPELIARIFEFRLLSIIGYAPFVRGCVICGRDDFNRTHFSHKKCGFICESESCISNDRYAIEISSGAAKAIQHIVHSNIDSLFGFTVSQTVLEELGRVSRRYLRERLERDFTKLDFLKELNIN